MTQPPVALFVFNRYEKLPETLACLKHNKITKLYIFCDGARDAKDESAITKVRAHIKNITWIKPTIVEHQKNLGLSESIEFGLARIFRQHDRVVVVEDDVCVAPGFYQYISEALELYKDKSDVAGVTGLRYPFDQEGLNGYPFTAFFAPRFSSWGWGTWRRFWHSRTLSSQVLAKQISNQNLKLDTGGSDMIATFNGYLSGSLKGSWDVCCAANMLVNQQYFVWPSWNMVRNTGLLGGTHSSEHLPGWELRWEGAPKSLKLPRQISVNDKIMTEFLDFFAEIKPKGDHMTSRVRTLGGKVKRRLIGMRPEKANKPHPSEYTTTDGPMEVPVQIEAYFIALNNYITEGDSVLDVGSGLGYGLNLLSIKSGSVAGVDIDEKAIAYTKSHYWGRNPKLKELKVYDGYHLPYKDKSFDVITTIDVLEHVEDYDAYIDELLRVARKAVIVSTPNRREEHTNPDGTPKNHWHLREWSRAELDEILRRHDVGIEWHHVNGPWEGPFTVTKELAADTMTLTPVLLPKSKS